MPERGGGCVAAALAATRRGGRRVGATARNGAARQGPAEPPKGADKEEVTVGLSLSPACGTRDGLPSRARVERGPRLRPARAPAHALFREPEAYGARAGTDPSLRLESSRAPTGTTPSSRRQGSAPPGSAVPRRWRSDCGRIRNCRRHRSPVRPRVRRLATGSKVGLSHQDETVPYRTRIEAASILYDADCGFCRWSLAQLLCLDRHSRLRPVSLQDPEADILLSGMTHEQRMASWHLVDEAGRVHSGGEAFSPLVRLIAGWDRFARVLAAFPSLSDLAYRTVARRRSWLGRLIPAASSARARQRIQAAANRQPSGEDRHRPSQTACP